MTLNVTRLRLQQTHIIGPLKNAPRCISYVQLNLADTDPTDAVLLGDDQGYVTLMSIDMKDLTGLSSDAISKSGRRIVYVEPKNLTSWVRAIMENCEYTYKMLGVQ